MIKASLNDRHLVANILSRAYDTNDTINETVNEPAEKRVHNSPLQETRRRNKIYRLMTWAFDLCYRYGGVFLSEDKKAAALIVYPDKKKFSFSCLIEELKLIPILGLLNIPKVMQREMAYNKLLPAYIIKPMFLGTLPEARNQGRGSELMACLAEISDATQRPIYLDARIKKNEIWFSKQGFETFHRLTLGDRSWACMRREFVKVKTALC